VLSRLYPQVATLRHYLLSRLPSSSKNRRRKLAQLGLHPPDADATSPRGIDDQLGDLLDAVVVGGLPSTTTADAAVRKAATQEREDDLESFSQQFPAGTTASTFKPGYFLQPEVSGF
jgi:hypothetical protein